KVRYILLAATLLSTLALPHWTRASDTRDGSGTIILAQAVNPNDPKAKTKQQPQQQPKGPPPAIQQGPDQPPEPPPAIQPGRGRLAGGGGAGGRVLGRVFSRDGASRPDPRPELASKPRPPSPRWAQLHRQTSRRPHTAQAAASRPDPRQASVSRRHRRASPE